MKTAEDELIFYKQSLAKIAEEFGIVSYWQMVALSENNEQNLVDILIKHIQTTRKTEKLDAYKAGLSKAAEIANDGITTDKYAQAGMKMCAETIPTHRDNLKEIPTI